MSLFTTISFCSETQAEDEQRNKSPDAQIVSFFAHKNAFALMDRKINLNLCGWF